MWESIISEDLRPPDRYAWYCRRARDLIEQFDRALWQVRGEHVPVPESFWAFEDRSPEDDPDWDQQQAFMWDFRMTREQSLAQYHRRWRDNPELDQLWAASSGGVISLFDVLMQEAGAVGLGGIRLGDNDTAGPSSEPRTAIPEPDWKSIPCVAFLWGPAGCGKTELAKVIGWMMRNMVGGEYKFVHARFRVPPESSGSGVWLFKSLIEEIKEMKNRVILLDDFVDSLPDPEDGQAAATDRTWVLRTVCSEIRKDRMRCHLEANRSVLLIASRGHTREDRLEIDDAGPHYYLRPPETDLEREAVVMLGSLEGGIG